jgi:hypothetical protein
MRKETHAIFMIGKSFHDMKMHSFDIEDKKSMIKSIEALLPDFWNQYKTDEGRDDDDFTLGEIIDLIYSLPSFSNENVKIAILDNEAMKQLIKTLKQEFLF